MRKSILLSAIAAVGLAAGAAVAAPTLTVSVGVSTAAAAQNTATAGPLTVAPGATVYLYFYGSTNTLQDPASDSTTYNGAGYVDTTGQTVAGGIRGTELDLTTGGTASYAATTNVGFSSTVSSNFSTNKPVRQANASNSADFNAVGFSFTDSGNFNDVTMGTTESTTDQSSGAFAGMDYLGYEKWTVNGTTTFTPAVVGPIYYDSNSASNFQSNYADTVVNSATVTVPEPASLSLLGLGALGLIARRRRA